MDKEFAEMGDYLRVLKKRKILFMFFVIGTVIIALVKSLMPPSYSTSAVLNLRGLNNTVYANPSVAIEAVTNKEALKKALSDLKIEYTLEEIDVSTEVLNVTQQDGSTIPAGIEISINSRLKDKLDVILNRLVTQFLQKNKEIIDSQRTTLKGRLESINELLTERKNAIENKKKIINDLPANLNYQLIDRAILSSLYAESIIIQEEDSASLLKEQSELSKEASNLDESAIFIPASSVSEVEGRNPLLDITIITFFGLVLGLIVVFLVEFLSTVN